MSIATYLTALDRDRDALAANLTTKGVPASSSETFTTLVPKVLDIPSGGSDISCKNITINNVSAQTGNVITKTFEKIKISDCTITIGSSQNGAYILTGLNNVKELTFENVNFSGTFLSANTFNRNYSMPVLQKITFKNCTFGQTGFTGAVANNYNIKEIVFDGCTASFTRCEQMFNGNSGAEKIDISSFDFTGITAGAYYDKMFNSVPTTCTIYVKDAANQSWFSAKFPTYTFTIKS